MDKPHCDRCDAIIEAYRSWVEVLGLWADTGDTHIVHIQTLNHHSHRPPPAFCLLCWVRILRQYCDELVPPVVVATTEQVKASAKRIMSKHARAFEKLARGTRSVKKKAKAKTRAA